MKFVNRTDELDSLNSWWGRRDPRAALVWGRRRVGKTALLRHFADGLAAPTVFYTGTGQGERVELAELCRVVVAVVPDPLRDLAMDPYVSWRDLLDHLARHAESAPILLVLDEFPELVNSSPALPGILRAFLDRTEGRSRLRLVLSGSAVRPMEAMREYRAPLYGRFDLTLLLHPFRPHEAALMLPALTPAERALVYGIAGGTPLYLSWWDSGGTVVENLAELVGRPGAPLLTEGQLIMATEVGGGEHTAGVLAAIASGRTRNHEIGNAIGADPTRTLDRLIELRIVERVLPVTESGSKSRRRVYRISDNYLGFYLGPLSRVRNEIEQGIGAGAIASIVRHLDGHMGPVYEEAYRAHLRRLANDGVLGDDVVAVGPWWKDDGNDEIDAVVLAEPGLSRVPVMAGECKWARRADGARLVAGLARKAGLLTRDVADLRYSICAREEVHHAPAGTLVVTSADIFGIPGDRPNRR